MARSRRRLRSHGRDVSTQHFLYREMSQSNHCTCLPLRHISKDYEHQCSQMSFADDIDIRPSIKVELDLYAVNDNFHLH